LNDITIDGSGSTLVFLLNNDGIHIDSCRRIKITNVVIEYALKMGALGQVVVQGDHNVLKVNDAFPVTNADTIGHIAEYDSAMKSFVPGGMRVYLPPGSKEMPKYIGDQTYTSAAFQTKGLAGKTFVIFQHWYGGTAIQIKDPVGKPRVSEDIIFDNVTIHSGPGMGIVAHGMKRGIAIWNSKITPAPGGLISTEYDAIHMLLEGGDVSIKNNLISNQGDDGVNLSNPVHPVVRIDENGRSLVLSNHSRFIQIHDRLTAFDPMNKYLGSAEVVETPKSLGGPDNQWYSIKLDNSIPGLTLQSLFRDDNLVNSRVALTHNVVQNCQCHGLLAQVPNALIEDNAISNTTGSAIRLLSSEGYFKEGVGAINVLVQNNRISGSGIDANIQGLHQAAISIYGNGSSGITAEPSNAYVNLIGNTISDSQQGCISVESSEIVKVSENHCNNTNLSPSFQQKASISISYSSQVTLKGNHRSGPQTGAIDVDPSMTKDIQTQPSY
jgi:hypothetical protein